MYFMFVCVVGGEGVTYSAFQVKLVKWLPMNKMEVKGFPVHSLDTLTRLCVTGNRYVLQLLDNWLVTDTYPKRM